jgi:hypothetical protein
LTNVNSFGHSRTSGVLLDEAELLRQRLILNGHKIEESELLEIDRCLKDVGVAELYLWLEESGLVQGDGSQYRFTPAGFKYRDIIAHSLFSPATRALVTSYEYA